MNERKPDLRPGPEEYRLQGHWLLAKMGKRVLRPGGIEMTERLLEKAAPSAADRIVEFGPGVGRTAEQLLAQNPVAYTAVDPNPEGAPALQRIMAPYAQATKVVADASETGLPNASADLVVGEAMLTMQSPTGKREIVQEAARILAPGGRYLVHELGFHPDDLPAEVVKEVQKGLSRSIKVGARPLTTREWRELLESAGLEVEFVWTNPMHLLEPKRMIQDEGVFGFLRFVKNMITNPAGRKRVLGMRKVFRTHQQYLNAIGLVARKP